MPRLKWSLALTVGALALAATACGGGDLTEAIEAEALECPPDSECYDPPRAVGGEPVGMSVDTVEFDFVDWVGAAVEGDIQITLTNVGQADHNIEIVGANEGSVPRVQAPPGETEEGVFNLFAGEYTYFCSIPGHRAAGMEGTLTVYATPEEAEGASRVVYGPDDVPVDADGTDTPNEPEEPAEEGAPADDTESPADEASPTDDAPTIDEPVAPTETES